MCKSVNEEKIGNSRGWEALERMLRKQGLADIELEEARKSFHEGIEILSKLFIAYEDDKKK